MALFGSLLAFTNPLFNANPLNIRLSPSPTGYLGSHLIFTGHLQANSIIFGCKNGYLTSLPTSAMIRSSLPKLRVLSLNKSISNASFSPFHSFSSKLLLCLEYPPNNSSAPRPENNILCLE
eukprot:NODE_175_length_15885_cov_0.420563.p12 type:complete len:121 gc:universal NODE_175_length_15885_cov_0.420563:1163-801(-)